MSDQPRILVVDDDRDMAKVVAEGLNGSGFAADICDSGTAALDRLSERSYAGLVTDLRIPDLDGLALLERVHGQYPELPVILMTAFGAIDTAIESIRQGAYHYLIKPFKTDELVLFLRRALGEVAERRDARNLRRTLVSRGGLPGIIGQSAPMLAMQAMMVRVAESPMPVLLTGETGTGKGLVARTIHEQGLRKSRSFVTLNCAAVPAQLIESELFGHTKGAFTGANQARAGLVAEADGGTLFLDEIGDLDLSLQAKLLDVLERGVVRPVGGERERKVDVRIIAATHVQLREAVRAGRFREDLLYRLDVVTIRVPPLRDRREDLPLLCDAFLFAAKSRHPRSPVERIAPAALHMFSRYHWPGNVRELMHVIERLVILAQDKAIDAETLAASWEPESASAAAATFAGGVQQLRQIQRAYAAWALTALGGSKVRTADALDVDIKTLNTLLKESE